MNKRNVQSFALGIFMTVSLSCAGFYLLDESIKEPNTIEDTKAFLENSGYVVLPEKEYNQLLKKKAVTDNEEMPQQNKR